MDNEESRRLLEENLKWSKENNRLLRKIRRAATYGLIIRTLWMAVLIGVPLALYVYILEPYYTGLRSEFEQFKQKIENLPGANLLRDRSSVPKKVAE